MNYLFIGAHCDDIEISSIGYLLKLLKDGHSVFMIVCTLPYIKKEAEIRKKEQGKVVEELSKYKNFKFEFFHFIDGELYDHFLELKNTIESFINKNNIQKVVTHFNNDTHPDHETLSKAVDCAARKISIINFESPNVFGFIPNYFIELSKEDIKEKINLMKLHRSQNVKNNNFYIDKIKSNAMFRGQSVYCDYAEAFFIKRVKE